MRFSSVRALLFFCALAGSVASVTGCASDTTATGDSEAALGDDELDAVNDEMGLRLTYDDPSGRVRATLKMKLQAGEHLVLRLRRGRLMPGGQSDLDCFQLGEAPLLVPPSPSTPAPTGTATSDAAPSTTQTSSPSSPSTTPIYEGPEVDRSMLASVYNEQWVDQNISADVLEQLSVDGTDAIVDACIIHGEGVRARLQTSLQYAWDTSDPRIDPALAHP